MRQRQEGKAMPSIIHRKLEFIDVTSHLRFAFHIWKLRTHVARDDIYDIVSSPSRNHSSENHFEVVCKGRILRGTTQRKSLEFHL